MTPFFYLVLKRLQLPRVIAFSAVLLFALLPNYSADRFWYAAFQANVSMAMYFLSLYAGLRALSIHTKQPKMWKVISICALFISVLSYEVVLPLFFLNLLFYWNPLSKIKQTGAEATWLLQKKTMFIIFNCIALFYIIIFKATTSIRLDTPATPTHHIQLISKTIFSAFSVNYGVWLAKLPLMWYSIATQYANMPIIISGTILGIAIFGYVYYMLFHSHDSQYPNRSWMAYATGIGFILFIFGYSIFFTNQNVGFSPTGIENRVAIAASIGFAFSLIGMIGWLSRIIPSERLSRLFFCTSLTVLCVSGYIIINTLSLFWIAAAQENNKILTDITTHINVLPKDKVIILDGICPYIGPATVFESQWDLRGAMQIMYQDPSIVADVVTPRLKIESDGLHTSIYSYPSQYQYDHIVIYNYQTKQSYSIINEQTARSYFKEHNPDLSNGCPPSKTGSGVSIF